jgi:hypothetical protein
MKKTLLYKLFGLGRIPRQLRPLLESEGIVVADEGIGGWFITKHVNGPGRRYRNRAEGFSGCLVVTKKRILCYTYWKRQINISVDDPKVSVLQVTLLKAETLSIAFESSVFREEWSGVIEFRFNTERAQLFHDTLRSIGARGSASEVLQRAGDP